MEKRTCLIVKTKKAVQRVDFCELLYGQKDGRKIILQTTKGEVSFFGTIKEMEKQLDQRFLMCHYSYFINMDYIVKMEDETIFLRGNRQIYLGRETFRRGKLAYLEYMEGQNGEI